MPDFAPEILHEYLLERAPRILRFDPEDFFPEWQSAVRRSFKQLLGLMPAKGPLDVQIVSESDAEFPVAHRAIRFQFTAEPSARVPCSLLIPKGSASPCPLVICLQGHGPGAYWSLGEIKNPHDAQARADGQDFALQALQNGYAALVMEMRCFGERIDRRPPAIADPSAHGCRHASMVALLLGRTMAGERVFDVTRAIDAVTESFPQIDAARIAVMGFSGGGLIAYYAAAFEPRIAAVIAASSLCTLKDSIARIDHCPDNYIPNILHYFETADLAGLIVPRTLVIVTGEADPIFPITGVRECFEDIQAIYRSQNVADEAVLLVGADGHRPYPDLLWPAFNRMAGWAETG